MVAGRGSKQGELLKRWGVVVGMETTMARGREDVATGIPRRHEGGEDEEKWWKKRRNLGQDVLRGEPVEGWQKLKYKDSGEA